MMTSKPSPTACFAYMTLPGEIAPVVAGRFELTADRTGTPVGRFIYGRSYLARREAVAIDPVELRLSTGTFETVAMNGVFGACRLAISNAWMPLNPGIV